MSLIFATLLLAFVRFFNSIELSLQSGQKDVNYIPRPRSPPQSEISTNQERPVQLPIRSQSLQGYVNTEEAPPPPPTPAIRPLPIRMRPPSPRLTPAIRPLPTRIRPKAPQTTKAIAIRPLPIRIRPVPPQRTQAVRPLPMRIRPLPMRIRPLPPLPPPPLLPPPILSPVTQPQPIRIRTHPVPENTPFPETYSNESSGSNVLEHQ